MSDVDTSPAALRALAEAATPGPWQVVTYRTPFSITRHDGTTCSGEHVGRDIATVRHHPQSHAPYPIVTLGIGVTQETPVHFVFIRPEDADYLAAVSPEVVLALLDTIDALRASLAAAEKEWDDWKAAATAHHPNPADYRYWEGRYRDEAVRAEKAEAERDALAGRRPKVLLHWGPDGDFSWGATDGLDVVCVDERCPNDRVYETTGALSVEVIQRVADGRARHPIDALDQIAREATTPEDPVHD